MQILPFAPSLPSIDGQALATLYQETLQQAVRRLANKAAKNWCWPCKKPTRRGNPNPAQQ